MKAAPPSARLKASIVPSWASTTLLAMARPRPRAARVAGARVVSAIETGEEKLRVDVAEPRAVVEHADDGAIGQAFEPDDDMPALADEAGGVRHQIVYDLLQAVGNAQDVGRLARDLERAAAFLHERAERVGHILGDGVQVHALHHHLVGAFFDVLQRQKLIGHARKPLRFADDSVAETFAQLLGHIGVHERFRVAANGGQRRAQLWATSLMNRVSAFLLHGKVADLGFRLFAEGGEIVGEQIGLVELAVGLDGHARVAFEPAFALRCRLESGSAM